MALRFRRIGLVAQRLRPMLDGATYRSTTSAATSLKPPINAAKALGGIHLVTVERACSFGAVAPRNLRRGDDYVMFCGTVFTWDKDKT
jgi:hypothetical protein